MMLVFPEIDLPFKTIKTAVAESCNFAFFIIFQLSLLLFLRTWKTCLENKQQTGTWQWKHDKSQTEK